MSRRAIDPVECSVRHIVRAAEGDRSAQRVGKGYLGRDDVLRGGVDGLAGDNGWARATASPVLSDEGKWTLELPNEVGSDGILHRDRFHILTDDGYQPGEEYVEIYTDLRPQGEPLFVGTPTDARVTPSAILLEGVDVPGILQASYAGDIEDWQSKAPVDVLRHYTRLQTQVFGETLALELAGGSHFVTLPAWMPGDCWTAEAIFQVPGVVGGHLGKLSLTMGQTSPAGNFPIDLEYAPIDPEEPGWAALKPPGGEETAQIEGKYLPAREPGASELGLNTIALKLVAFYDHVFAYVNGELVADYRRRPGEMVAPKRVTAGWDRPELAVKLIALRVETPLPFAGQLDANYDLILPGLPPPEGLHAQVWGAATIFSQYPGFGVGAEPQQHYDRTARLWSAIADNTPAIDRIEPHLAHANGSEEVIPGPRVARWSGAIYLEPGEKLKWEGRGSWRVWVGKTLVGHEAAANWYEPEPTGVHHAEIDVAEHLSTEWLGEGEAPTMQAGWYPIVVEQLTRTGGWLAILTRWDGAKYVTVPSSRLSPLGVYANLVRLTPHRQLLDDIVQNFGYQWRAEPASLESGLFPGQISARVQQGRQLARTISEGDIAQDDEETEAAKQVSAGDVVDGVVVDAAGIASPRGASQLSGELIDYDRANSHLALRKTYESLAEITERPLLLARLNSLLALRSSPNEQVGVRPKVQVELVDDFKLTGDPRRFDWRVGDAPLLDLEKIAVKDTEPRQLTTMTWDCRPAGLGAPTVGFRSRPRHPKAVFRKMLGGIVAPRRTPQGQVAVANGSLGATNAAMAPDIWSRVGAPASIVSVVLDVIYVDGTGWEIVCSPGSTATGKPVDAAGQYDLTGIISPATSGGGALDSYLYASLQGGTGGSNNIIQLIVKHVI